MTKYDPPSGPPPPAYNSDGAGVSTPQPTHLPHGQSSYETDNPYPGAGSGGQYPSQNVTQNGAYYAPGPQYQPRQQQPQGGYYGPQQGYGQQQGMGYGPQPMGYGPQQGYGQQGGYYDNRRNGSSGFMEAMLASLACCCCLDACLLF